MGYSIRALGVLVAVAAIASTAVFVVGQYRVYAAGRDEMKREQRWEEYKAGLNAYMRAQFPPSERAKARYREIERRMREAAPSSEGGADSAVP